MATNTPDKSFYYLGNQKLKRVNVPMNYGKKEIREFKKCAENPIYFIRNYVKIINVDKGLMKFALWDWQEEMIKTFVNNRFSICKIPRQSGKTQSVVALLLWYALFHEDYSILILAHKASQSREILSRVQLAFENLPMWLQQGVVEWNKGTVILENGSKIETSATSAQSARGTSRNLVYCVAGHSKMQFLFEGIEIEMTMDQLHSFMDMACLNNNKENILFEDINYDIFRQQIYKNILQNNKQKNIISDTKRKIFNRETPYHSEMLWGDRRKNKFNYGDIKGTYNPPSFINKNDFESKNSRKINVFLSQNVKWSAGEISQYIRNVTEKINNTNIFTINELQSWKKTLTGNSFKTINSSEGKNYQRRNSKEIEYEFAGEWQEYSENRRTSKENITGIEWKKKTERIGGSYKQESRKNTKNGGEASRNETFTRIQNENEYSSKKSKNTTLEQGIKVLTEQGYKNFKGIKRNGIKNTIKLITNNNSNFIECTSDHKIMTKNEGWQEAKDCLNKIVVTKDGINIVNSIEQSNTQMVYDLIEVEDTHSFYCNDILVHNCDEFAFVPQNIQDEFFSSAFPTLSSGRTTKMIITSTPNGIDYFHKIWKDSVQEKNQFVNFSVHWSDIPGRDEEWMEREISVMGAEKFRQEYGCDFIGSSNTLISPEKLDRLTSSRPISENENTQILKHAEKGNDLYTIIVDTSRGVGGDYSTIVVFDVSKIPYEVVAVYKDNKINPLTFPNIIYQFAKSYNDAYVCIEVNDNGQQVADILYQDLEYEHVVFTQMKGRAGQILSGGFANRPGIGMRTTKTTKRIGCANFKALLETDKLFVESQWIIDELYSFVEVGDSFQADIGHHDDLVMCCVIFGWLVQQPMFKDWTDTNVRERLVKENFNLIDEEILPFLTDDEDHYAYTDQITTISNREFATFLLED